MINHKPIETHFLEKFFAINHSLLLKMPRAAKIKIGGAINIARSACGIPSFEMITGKAVAVSHEKIIMPADPSSFLNNCRIEKIKPIKNIIPTGQKSSGLPEILCRQLLSP